MEITFTPREPGPFQHVFEDWPSLLLIAVNWIEVNVSWREGNSVNSERLSVFSDQFWAKEEIRSGAAAVRDKLRELYLPYNYESR